MSESIVSIREQLWEKMRGSGGKEYRDSFVAAHLSTSVAAQIQTLREDRGWTKRQLAKKTGMAATRISLMESPSYDKFTLTTLRRLASAFDVALEARFVSFSWLVDWVSDLSPAKLSAANFDEDSLAPSSYASNRCPKCVRDIEHVRGRGYRQRIGTTRRRFQRPIPTRRDAPRQRVRRLEGIG